MQIRLVTTCIKPWPHKANAQAKATLHTFSVGCHINMTERIHLTKYQAIWHYSIVPFILIVPVLSLWSVIEYNFLGTYDGVRNPNEDFGGYFFIIPAIIFYFIQSNRLRFKKCKYNGDFDSVKKAAEVTAEQRKWTIEICKKNFIQARRSWNWTGSWGELITIKLDNGVLMINSICDPDNITSVASWGENKRNLKTFLENLTKKETDNNK